ncbi:TetR/AcrR family transcriptional regulator [Marinomonas epiphytica]
MPYSTQHKEKTRQRILQSAARLFCTQGFDRVTLSKIMREANMTHGAFYAHFSGKSSLYEAAMNFASSHAFWARNDKSSEYKDTHLKALITRYLKWGQPNLEQQSPLEFLVTDSAHKDEKVRAAYQQCFDSLVDKLASILSKQGSCNAKDLAEEMVISLVGTVTIARSMGQTLQRDFIERAKERIFKRVHSSISSEKEARIIQQR